MANARMDALLSRRSPTLGSGSIRILTPQNTGISSIAKRNAANESEVMINKYNNGLISNEEMKSFLQGQVSSPYISESDKIDIQAKLQDFDTLIQKDKLESVFKLAPENSLQKEQAATALAQFYTQRASTMVEGTPAHSQALENAGNWQATVVNIQQSVSKQQRKNLENKLLQKINQLPTSSSERSKATAEMYKQLFTMANSQGDPEDAQVYAAKYEQAQTYAEQYGEQEQQKENIKNIKQESAQFDLDIAKLQDKSLAEAQAMVEKANTIAQRYADIGDQYNATRYATMAVQAQEKLDKKTADASAAEKNKLYELKDKDYSDNIRLAQEMYVIGKDGNGKPYTEERYKSQLSKVVDERKSIIEEIFKTANENEKVYWNGKTRKSSDVIDEIEKELNNVNGLQTAIDQGTVALFAKPPSEMIGKNTPQYELRDTRFLSPKEQQEWKPDESGVLHKGIEDVQEIDKSEFDKAKRRGMKGYTQGADGKYYKSSGLKFDVLDPVTGQLYKQQVGPEGKLVSAAQIRSEAKQLGYKEKDKIDFDPQKAAQINENQFAMSAEEVRKSREKIGKEKTIVPEVPLVDKIAEKTDAILPKKVTPIPEKRTLPQQIQDTISLSPVEAGKQIFQNLKQPEKAPMVSTVNQPVNIPQAVQSGGLSQPKPTQALSYNTPTPPKVTIATPTPVNIPQAVQSGGLKINYTPPPVPKPVVAPQPTTLQKIGTTIAGAAGQAVNKLKSFFKW